MGGLLLAFAAALSGQAIDGSQYRVEFTLTGPGMPTRNPVVIVAPGEAAEAGFAYAAGTVELTTKVHPVSHDRVSVRTWTKHTGPDGNGQWSWHYTRIDLGSSTSAGDFGPVEVQVEVDTVAGHARSSAEREPLWLVLTKVAGRLCRVWQ